MADTWPIRPDGRPVPARINGLPDLRYAIGNGRLGGLGNRESGYPATAQGRADRRKGGENAANMHRVTTGRWGQENWVGDIYCESRAARRVVLHLQRMYPAGRVRRYDSARDGRLREPNWTPDFVLETPGGNMIIEVKHLATTTPLRPGPDEAEAGAGATANDVAAKMRAHPQVVVFNGNASCLHAEFPGE